MAQDNTSPLPTPPNTVTLAYPVQRGDTLISTLHIRKPQAGDMRGLKLMDLLQLDVSSYCELLPRIAGISKAEAMQLELCDLADIGEVVSGFFDKPTAATPTA